uniref:SFRICE_011783 n=1 Tax=Spodoptera frugiperda TaxID=7108 RepID=A0A2H1V6G9_SPOFR
MLAKEEAERVRELLTPQPSSRETLRASAVAGPSPATVQVCGRYAYHPYRGVCVFIESYFCQYNINFFHAKEYCEEYCGVAMPLSFCNMETGTPIDYTYIYDQK